MIIYEMRSKKKNKIRSYRRRETREDNIKTIREYKSKEELIRSNKRRQQHRIRQANTI